jgi:phosphatidylglycerol:prolipoprotein diacylglycerol transferase
MMFALPYPMIDPVIFSVGPLAVRWYALAYIFGLLGAIWYMKSMIRRPPEIVREIDVDDFLVWATLGVVLGGRIGYVLFYKPGFFLDHPAAIFQVWQGGMSFHGGFLGVVVATWLFSRKRGINLMGFADMIACAAPIGLFLGRIANFVNGELIGRVSDVPWAMVFPHGGPQPRHPSQLYEALLEGLVLFLVLYFMRQNEVILRRAGLLTGVFFMGYGLARSVAELFRQPDYHIGFLLGGTTMGQWLSVPLILFGIWLVVRAKPVT